MDTSTARLRVVLKKTHLTPVVIQLVLLAYWALHWAPLRGRLLALLWLVPCALALDTALVRLRLGELRLSLAALPVVFSATLFTNYPLRDSAWMGLVVGVALLSKALIRSRGRHVFNPSALGLSLLGVLTLVGVAPLEDVAHAFSAPPNMDELVLIVALVAQLRVPVVLATLGAVLGLIAWAVLQTTTGLIPGGVGLVFSPGWAPVLLVLVLLITDPATMPKSPSGKLIFGVAAGLGMGLWGDVLSALGQPDFFGKVLAVPTANALTPWFERWGRRLDARATWLARRHNRRHVALWFALGAALVVLDGKPSHYSDNLFVHLSARPPLLKVGADGLPTCTDNPVYCRPFSLLAELRCWGGELALGPTCSDDVPIDEDKLTPFLRSHWTERGRGPRPLAL